MFEQKNLKRKLDPSNPFSIRFFSLVLFLFLSIVSCGSSKTMIHQGLKPGWVNGQSSRYSKDSYIAAVGNGRSRQEAEKQARVALSQVFQVRIDSVTQAKTVYKELDSDQSSSYALEQKIFREVKEETHQILEGVEIAEIWSPPLGDFHALAVLHRMNAVLRLQSEMAQIDQKLDSLIEMTEKEGMASGLFDEEDLEEDLEEEEVEEVASEKVLEASKAVNIKELRFYLQMAPLVKRREGYINQLLVLSPTFFKVEDRGYEKIPLKLHEILSGFLIEVSLTGEGSDKIRNAIVEGLTQANFKVVDIPGESTHILLRGDVKNEAIMPDDPTWKWTRSEVSIDMVDNQSNQVFGRIQKSRREGSKELTNAQEIALDKISQELIQEVNERLMNYLQKG